MLDRTELDARITRLRAAYAKSEPLPNGERMTLPQLSRLFRAVIAEVEEPKQERPNVDEHLRD